MQLKSLKLINFRQYINEEIQFSTDSDRNVTIITGTLGAGKSTLQQAFKFVLYGLTEFNNEILLNNKIKKELEKGKSATTEVSLEFSYKNCDYLLTRSQPYLKLSEQNLLTQSTKIELIEIQNGNYKPLKDEMILKIISQMLPKQLKDYFFIDGEVIGDMSKNIADSSKQEEFSKAVKSILGLNYLSKSIDHLKAIQKNYSKEIDNLGGKKIQDLSSKIDEAEAEVAKIVSDIDYSNDQEKLLSDLMKELDMQIRLIPNATSLQNEFINNKSKIDNRFAEIELLKQKILTYNSSGITYYIGEPLIKNSLNMLKSNKSIDYGIPHLHSKTIEYIIETGKCICGKDIYHDKESKERLNYLLSTVPPQSIGLEINSYLKEASIRISNTSNFHDLILDSYKLIRDKTREINDIQIAQSSLNEQMLSITSVLDKKRQYDQYEERKNNIKREISRLTKDLGIAEGKRDTLIKEKEASAFKNNASMKIEGYKVYVDNLLTRIQQHYLIKENEIRLKLQDNINQYLENMYEEGFSVEIDEKYRIRINVDEAVLGDNIDKSKGQGFLIIFAFISSVISMAKEKNIIDDEENASEFYPLVMDAPISTIDKDYIEKICKTLPKVAEQIIIFLNKKDSEIFQKYASQHIGRSYILEVNGHLETGISEVKNV